MARYIDADKLIEKWENTLKDKNPDDLAYKCFTLFIDGVKKEPSADVVPKSEVESLKDLNKQLEIDNFNANMNLDLVQQELAKAESKVEKIFEEIENRAYGFGACFVEMTRTTFDEIKKKYTESEDTK